MGTAVGTKEAARRHLAKLYEPVEGELRQVETLLQQELESPHAAVGELTAHSLKLGGKRLRPAFVLLAGSAAGRVTHEHVVLGTVMEMIHTATLIHDDVLDSADLRRHVQTSHALFGREASVLLGDYLFTHAFFLCSSLESTFACRTIGRATNIVCEGEMRQIASRGRFEIDEEEYLSIIEGKTAELCACCCQLGAHYAGADEATCEALDRFGRYLGIAFQIVDDLLDVEGDESVTGKSLGTDLDQQKPTLPIIRLLETLNGTRREQVLRNLQSSDAEARSTVRRLLVETESLAYARNRAEEFASRARDILDVLAAGPARQSLELMAHFVVHRPT